MTASALYEGWDWRDATPIEFAIEAPYLAATGQHDELARLREAAEQRGIEI